MNKSDVTKFFKGMRESVQKHSPEILTGIGVAGMITTTVLAVKATPKALRLIEAAEQEKEEPTDLTPIEIVKIAWKPYIPAVALGVCSTACIIGASSVNARRNAALATAYQLSTTALSDYKEKVIETIGEKKEQTVRDKVAQKKVEETPSTKSEVVITGGGTVLFLEPVSMRYFKSDVQTVRKIVNDINYRLTVGMEEYISLSEFYDEIGLSHTSTSDDIGWNLSRDGQITIDMPAATTETGEPCLVLDYSVSPRYDFTKLM